MTTDSYVPVLTVSSGPNVEVSQLTNDAGTTVQRQRFAQGDPALVDALQKVKPEGAAMVASDRIEFLLAEVVAQLKTMNIQLSIITGVGIDDRDASLAIFSN